MWPHCATEEGWNLPSDLRANTAYMSRFHRICILFYYLEIAWFNLFELRKMCWITLFYTGLHISLINWVKVLVACLEFFHASKLLSSAPNQCGSPIILQIGQCTRKGIFLSLPCIFSCKKLNWENWEQEIKSIMSLQQKIRKNLDGKVEKVQTFHT